MSTPRSLGAFYGYLISYPDGIRIPVAHLSTTTEIEPPFRHGKCMLLRVPFMQSSVVIGRWGSDTLDEKTAYETALGFRVLEDNGSGWEDDLV